MTISNSVSETPSRGQDRKTDGWPALHRHSDAQPQGAEVAAGQVRSADTISASPSLAPVHVDPGQPR